MKDIELSVIIPTHKRKEYLFFELEQIYKQKEVNFEVIVVNDIVGLDETDTIREQYPEVIYIKDSEIQGPSNKHKAGYKIAKGNYLYMPDDDDYLIDDYFFRKAIDRMEQDHRLAIVSGQCQRSYEFEDEKKNYQQSHRTSDIGRIDGREYLQEFQHKISKPLSSVSTIFRKKAFDETDAINMIEMSDSSMYMQALLWGDAYIMEDLVAVYRIKGGSLTNTASYAFMKNVIEQKELLYKKSIGYIKHPKHFWAQQFILTYNFLPNKNVNARMKILSWLKYHLHGSVKLFLFFFRELFKLLINFKFYLKVFKLLEIYYENFITNYLRYFINSIYYGFSKDTIQVNAWVDVKYGRINNRNWGDDINVYLIEKISSKKVVVRNQSLFHKISKKVNYICIGSILGWYENKFSEVWGSGFISKDSILKCKPYKIHSVRGKLTRKKLLEQGINCPESYGDPALLVSKYYKPIVDKIYKVGFITHYVDYDNSIINEFISCSQEACIKINLMDYKQWTDIIDQICSCDIIFSSSLHGLIVADSYYIPNVWMKLSNKIFGEEFKYLDYFSSVEREEITPYVINNLIDIENILKQESIYESKAKIDFQAILNSCPFVNDGYKD